MTSTRIQDSTTVDQAPIRRTASACPDEDAVARLLFYCRDDVRTVSLSADQSLVVGRTFPAQVIFDDRSLSRQHARIGFEDGLLSIQDLDSKNRVWVNGEPIERAAIHVGDAIRLGHLTVTVEPTFSRKRVAGEVTTFRAFQAHVQEELARAAAYHRPLSVLMLRRAGKWPLLHDWCPQIASRLRCADRGAIYGADTLAVLLAETDGAAAAAWAEDMSRAVASKCEGRALRVGIASFPNAAHAEALIGMARTALSAATDAEPIQREASPTRKAISDQSQPVVLAACMHELHALTIRVARSRLPVLILGETGTGKEVVAAQVHAASPVHAGPFKVLNCAALAPTLMEDTLFGHEAGAFTGANRAAPGLFEQADGGTLFLDEVGELSPGAQAALLRVLETGVITRLGSRKDTHVDVRVVAATHRDLPMLANEGQFRTDLLHRLNAVTLRVPPLRERREEIAPLAARFLRDDRLPEDGPSDISAEAMACLGAHAWPGNVRELRNVIERAAVVAMGPQILPTDLPAELRAPLSEPTSAPTPGVGPIDSAQPEPQSQPEPDLGTQPTRSFRARIRDYELALIEQALRETGGHKANAAKLLNIPLRTLMTRIQK